MPKSRAPARQTPGLHPAANGRMNVWHCGRVEVAASSSPFAEIRPADSLKSTLSPDRNILRGNLFRSHPKPGWQLARLLVHCIRLPVAHHLHLASGRGSVPHRTTTCP